MHTSRLEGTHIETDHQHPISYAPYLTTDDGSCVTTETAGYYYSKLASEFHRRWLQLLYLAIQDNTKES